MLNNDADEGEALIDLARRGQLAATGLHASSENLPERALLRAVLQEAILDVRGCATGTANAARRRAADQAYYWFVSREVSWAFAFENVCAMLGFDADCLRQWVLREATLGPQAAASDGDSTLRAGGTLRAVRAARMRGNPHKGQLRLRRRYPAASGRRRAPTSAASDGQR